MWGVLFGFIKLLQISPIKKTNRAGSILGIALSWLSDKTNMPYAGPWNTQPGERAVLVPLEIFGGTDSYPAGDRLTI